jgi:hypothetical protein
MKNMLKIFLAVFILAGLWSCKKDEKKVIFEGGTQPVLSTSVNGQVPLSFATQGDQALKLNWTNPDYKFNTGVNSLDVNYNIQIDKTDKFNSDALKTISVGTDLSKTFTQGEFNDILLNQLQLDTTVVSPVYIRVDAFFNGGAGQLSSNALTISAKPYPIPPKVKLPVDGKLFLIGSATPGGDATGWNNPVPVPSQQFTQVTPTIYEITIDLIGGKQYLAIPVNGDWSHKYAVKGGPSASGGDFGYDWSDNFPGPATSGKYKISLDFQRGKFTVTQQ